MEVKKMLKIIYKLVIYTGILAFISLSITAFLGLTGINFYWHKILGITTFSLAFLHLGLNIYRNMKIKSNIKNQQQKAQTAQGGPNG
jgi:hypothetical protein